MHYSTWIIKICILYNNYKLYIFYKISLLRSIYYYMEWLNLKVKGYIWYVNNKLEVHRL